MPKHGKKARIPVWARVVGIVAIVAAVLAFLCALAISTGLLDTVASVFAPTETTVSTTQTTAATTTTVPPEPDPEYRFPEELKGAWLTAGKDYLLSEKNSGETVKQQIDTAFAAIDDWQFNTLLLPLHFKDKSLYESDLLERVAVTNKDGSEFDPLAYILSLARERQLYVYGIVDLHIYDDQRWDPTIPSERDLLLGNVSEQVSAYPMDGYFISEFSYAIGQLKAEQMPAAKTALDTTVAQAVASIRKANRNHYVGLLSTGVWAHRSVDERGSDTREYYEEMTDGCADTLSWIQQGLFDAVMVKNYASTNHPTAPFQKVLSWWSTVATEANVPLYMSHSANTIGSYKVGWKLTDQLAQQYLYCKSDPAWQGSAYDTLAALTKDKTGIAEALKKAHDGTLNEDFIYKTLTVTAPTKTTFTTTASTVKFEGGGDTNFPLTINGKEIALTEHGFFTETFDLSIGVNTFEFEHKGVKRTYTVTYKQTLLQSVSPNIDMTVEGGNPFIISAVARKGSVVKATLGEQTITLAEIPTKDDENSGEESDFATFSGSLTLPKGTIGADRPLGKVSVVASYNGISETMNGGKAVIEALPLPTTTTTTTTVATTTTTTVVGEGTTVNGSTQDGSSHTVVTTAPVQEELPLPEGGDKSIVVITADYAETFNGNAVDDYSRPYNSYLPKGTWDYLKGKVYNGSLSYYELQSGKRVYMRDAKVVSGAQLHAQELKNGTAVVSGSHTVFTFESGWRVPMYIHAAPQKYYKDIMSGTPHYGLEKYGQTAEYVDVTFHYVTAVPTVPDLSANPLFSSAQWLKEGENTYTLRLTLKKAGGYYGVSYVWNNGVLTLSFLNPVDISANTETEKLKGIRILIDPGHGSPTDKPWEAPFNLEYANTLKEKLESLGATVDMTRTAPLTGELPLENRTQMAHNKQYHMFISVHMNGANGKATGATVWYYYEQSYTPSKYIYDQMHAVEVPYGVGTSANGTPRSSGTNWGTLYLNRTIHDCPAVLLECAFLDNPKDKECLIDPIYRDKLMQAVTDGVVQYFSSQK